MVSSGKNYGSDYDSIKNANEGFRRLTKAFGLLPTATVITSPSGLIEYANPVFLSTGGYTQEDIEPDKQLACFFDDDSSRRLAGEIIPLILSSKKWTGELTLRRKDGSAYAADIFCSVIADDAGEPAHFLFSLYENAKRRKAEELLKCMEAQYRSLAENSPDLIARFDRQLRHLYVNPAAAKAGRYSQEEYVGKTISETGVSDREAGKWEERIKNAFETGRIVDVEDMFETPQGKKYFNTKFVPEREADGTIISVQSVAREITERKKVDDALRESEEKFRSFFELTADLVVIADIEGYFRMINPAWPKTLGYTKEELLGKPFMDFVHPDDKQKTIQVIAEKLKRGDTILSFENRYVRKDGGIVWLEWTSQPQAETRYIFAIARDITDRKKAEESLHERERFLASIIGDMHTFVAVLKTDGEIIFVNNSPLKVAGLKLEDVRGKKFHDISWWTYSDETRETIKKDLEQCALGSSISREIQVQILDRLIWIDLSIHPVYDEKGNVEYLVPEAQDITEHKKTEDSLWESQTRYHAFVENTVLGISVVDADYKILTTNTTFAGLFKKPACDFVGKYCFTEYEKRDAICPHCPGKRAMASGKTEEVETQGVRDDGTKFYVRNRAVPFFAPDGKVKGFIEMVEDIDERKKMEISLQESEEKYRQLVERANDGIIIIQEGIVKYANRCLMELWGGTMDTLVGHPFIDFIHPDERLRVMERYKQRMAGADVGQAYETAVVDHEGYKIPAELNAGIISYQGKPADMVYVRDWNCINSKSYTNWPSTCRKRHWKRTCNTSPIRQENCLTPIRHT
jgi:PAS domain S-box-containing protein